MSGENKEFVKTFSFLSPFLERGIPFGIIVFVLLARIPLSAFCPGFIRVFMFTFPALLWFLPLVGVVVLIHLINMFRHRRVEWAAMEFLLASYRKSRTRLLFQQLLLMLLRAAAIAVAVLMFAGPKLDGQLAQWFGGNRTHHIVCLDDSYSMNDRNAAQGGVPLFDDALAAVQKIAAGSAGTGGDRFTLLKFSSAEPVLAELSLDTDGRQTVQNTLKTLQASAFAGEPERMLAAADDYVQLTTGTKPVVYFISDFRRWNWENPDNALKQIENIRQHGGSVRMIRTAPSEHPNLTLEQLNLVDGIHAADIDILLDATVANYSQENADNVLMSLFVDDKMQLQQTVPRIAAGTKTVPPIRFPVRISSGSEPHRIEVRLQPDALSDDNRRFMVLSVPDALEVLLIAPSLSVSAETAAQYVRVALAPGGTKSGIRTRLETPSFLAEKPLEQFSAIFLLDLPKLEPSAVAALEKYAAAGGGVAFFAGEQTDIDFVRESLYKKGTGLFPASPLSVQTLDPDFLTKSPDVRTAVHPIFRLFGEGESPLISNVNVEQYLGVEKTGDTVRILATLRNQAPLVLEKPFGAGKTMTFLTTASPVWNNWGRGNPSYVVVMLELTAWLSKRTDEVRTFHVGDPIEVKIDPAEFEEKIRITSPPREGESAGANTTIEAAAAAEGKPAVFTQTVLPGFYELRQKSRTGTEKTDFEAVNVNPQDGDLRIMDSTEVADLLKPIRQSLESAAGFNTYDNFGGDRPISDWLLYAVILFLIGETFLAGRILPPNRG